MHVSKTAEAFSVEMASATAQMMTPLASVFLGSLTDEQKVKAVFPVNSEERSNWDYGTLFGTPSAESPWGWRVA